MPLMTSRVVLRFWPAIFAASMIAVGLSGCGGASAPAAVSAPAPAKPRELGIHEFVGKMGESDPPHSLVDGTGSEARFYHPTNLAADSFGNVFVIDLGNKALRKVTAAGAVTTFARPDSVEAPGDAVIDAYGNLYQISAGDQLSPGVLSMITPTGATTIPTARVMRLAADKQGNIYTSSYEMRIEGTCSSMGPKTCVKIYKVMLHKRTASGVWVNIATFDEVREELRSYSPADILATGLVNGYGGIGVDATGTLYVADTLNHMVIKITAAGVVTTLAGMPGILGSADGVGAATRFFHPSDLVVDTGGNVYVNDSGNNTIRKITPSGSVTTVAGTAGKNELAIGGLPGSLPNVLGMTIDANGDLVLSVRDGLIKVTLP